MLYDSDSGDLGPARCQRAQSLIAWGSKMSSSAQDVGHKIDSPCVQTLRAEECGRCKGWQLGRDVFWTFFFGLKVVSSPSASSNFRTFDFTLHLGHVRLCPECRDSVDKQCTYCTLEGMRSQRGEIRHFQSPRTAKQCFQRFIAIS